MIADLASHLDALDAALATAREKLLAAEADRGRAILEGDGAALKNRTLIADLREEIADLSAARPVLSAKLEAARAAEAETSRKARYIAAISARNAAEKSIRTRYPRLRRDLLTLLREVAEADAVVAAANADLPECAAPLDGPESFRDQPALAEEAVKIEKTERWVARPEFGGGPVDPDAPDFVDRGDGSANFSYRPRGAAFPIVGEAQKIVTISTTVLPWSAGASADPLSSIKLPGLRHCDPAFDIGGGNRDADSILQAIERALAETSEPARQERQPVVRETSENMAPAGPRGTGYHLPRPADYAAQTRASGWR